LSLLDQTASNILFISNVHEKLRALPSDIERAFRGERESLLIPTEAPGRDVGILKKGGRGPKLGLSFREGQARLLHDLASIELQAMELAYRSFVEYPEAPLAFRHQMAELALSEGRHLRLCLDLLESMGHRWGDWPAYLSLWRAVSPEDSLLDRLVIVHRYLEASGLDAGTAILRRLESCEAPEITRAVRVITEEEVGHVAFGSHWYQSLCRQQAIDPDRDFKERLNRLQAVLPRRFDGIEVSVRKKAGFTEPEIQAAQELREFFICEKRDLAESRKPSALKGGH
jgi:uncharacterized ferritin-like protein (DUF455 family)